MAVSLQTQMNGCVAVTWERLVCVWNQGVEMHLKF